jgi:ectoine hydroxylase-related dioxygenase (phytanoyl-CoA dioxygenase family)
LNHPVHADRHEPGWHSIIYYVTDGDNPTVFTDIKYPNLEHDESSYNIVNKVEPRKGRVVIFPSELYHASTPTQLKKRVAANYVVKFEE